MPPIPASPAYDYRRFASAAPARAPRNRGSRAQAAEAIYAPARSERTSFAAPAITVIPNQRAAASQGVSTLVGFVGKVAAVVILAFTLLCVARVSLSSAAVATALDNQEISNQISTVRTESSALEITQSKLAAPQAVKEKAAELGMASPASVMMIDISGDVVKTDSNGDLSLSGSVAAAVQQAAAA